MEFHAIRYGLQDVLITYSTECKYMLFNANLSFLFNQSTCEVLTARAFHMTKVEYLEDYTHLLYSHSNHMTVQVTADMNTR